MLMKRDAINHGAGTVKTHRVVAAFCLSALVAAAATTAGSAVGGAASSCGGKQRALMTLSDPQRELVNLVPRKTTIRAINALSRPEGTPVRRNNAFNRQVWRVRAQIVMDRLDDDGDIQVILFDRGSYMIAELPAPACLTQATRARKAILRARHRFEQGCGPPGRSWIMQGALAYISGVGFWDPPSRQSGHAKNYAALHPVTDVTFIAGCDAEGRGGGP
jgi:hypothetical protein